MGAAGHRIGDLVLVTVAASAGYLAGLVVGVLGTATIEGESGRAVAALLVQLIAALSSVVAVAHLGRTPQATLRRVAAVTAAGATVLFVLLLGVFGHVLGAITVHGVAVVGLVVALLGRELKLDSDRSGGLAGTL